MPVVVGWLLLWSDALGRPAEGPRTGPGRGWAGTVVLVCTLVCWPGCRLGATVAWTIERDVGTGGLVSTQPLVADLAHFRQGACPELTHLILDRLYARWLLEKLGRPKGPRATMKHSPAMIAGQTGSHSHGTDKVGQAKTDEGKLQERGRRQHRTDQVFSGDPSSFESDFGFGVLEAAN